MPNSLLFLAHPWNLNVSQRDGIGGKEILGDVKGHPGVSSPGQSLGGYRHPLPLPLLSLCFT